jgi:hypothetical protein
MKLPPPESPLAGCVYLPRIIAKARAFKAGVLPQEYAVRFGAPDSVDGLFLEFFGLSAKQITEAAELSDAAVETWFASVPFVDAQRIQQWNHTAVNLGRPGFPMAERLPVALSTKYKHVADSGSETIFEMLNADERA